jgi:hypothetical protein
MVLDSLIKQKIFFDVKDKKHVDSYRKFLITGAWGKDTCPYILEFPYLTIPDMIKDKLIHSFLKIKKVTYASRYQ